MSDDSDFNDFCLLGQHIINIPKLQTRFHCLIKSQVEGKLNYGEAASLLHDLEAEEAKLALWPSFREYRKPHRSLPLQQNFNKKAAQALYPQRIDLYRDFTVANMYNAWRLVCVNLHIRISRISSILAKNTPPHIASTYTDKQKFADGKVREIIDDLCCSIPFFMNPDEPEAMLAHFPHAAGDANISSDPGPGLIVGMSQMKHFTTCAAALPSVPITQKQWLQQYLTLLSRDPAGDREKAMKLELR